MARRHQQGYPAAHVFGIPPGVPRDRRHRKYRKWLRTLQWKVHRLERETAAKHGREAVLRAQIAAHLELERRRVERGAV